MAYSKTPEQSTYKTVPIKFDGLPLYRHGNLTTQRDLNIINLYYDRVSQENKTREVFLKKRPGLAASGYNLTKSSASDVLRGHFYDSDANAFYWSVNDKVYRIAPDVGVTVRTVQTLTTSSGYVGFCSFLVASSNTKYIIFSDGTKCYYDNYVTTTSTEITDADMPTPHIPQPIYLDGYLFLAKTNTGDIYNSDVDAPQTWTASTYISAEMSSDYVIKLVLNKNYLVAFGKNSMEIFWDDANVSGSPLSRNDSGYKNIGYVTGMAEIGDKIFFVGQDKNNNIAVYQLEGFKVDRISNEIVDRTIQAIATTDNAKGQVSLDKNGYTISSDGHTFYVIVTTQTTWAYDVDEKVWYEWRGSDETYLKIEASWPMYNGNQYVAIAGQTFMSTMSPALYQDFSSNFTVQYTTERVNFDTYVQKACNRLNIMTDQQANSGSSTVTVAYSDDDWASSVTHPQTINVFSDAPFVYQLGSFRNRSFRLTYADNYPIRWKGLELEINMGNH